MKHLVDDSYRLLAAQYIRKQIRQLAGQIEGIRKAEDIEYVHRARVASRRLRAALGMFRDCFAAKRVKTWRKAVRQVTRDLGDARDKDVQILFVRGVLDRLQDKAQLPGVLRLLVHLERQRDAIQPAVLKALGRLQENRVLDKMLARTKQMSKGLEERGVTVVSEPVLSRGEQHILSRVDCLLALESSLADSQDVGQHHALRIAAKRLRYTVETCRPAYTGRIDQILAAIKQIQTLLGEIHDCDVWTVYLQAYLEDQQKRVVRLYGQPGPLDRLRVGIDYVRQDRQTERGQLFARLVSYWRELTEQGFWNALAEVVRQRPELAGSTNPSTPEEDPADPAVGRDTPQPCGATEDSNGKGRAEHLAAPAGQPGQTAQGTGRPQEVGTREHGQ